MNDNSNKVIEVDINEILPNRFQPRIKFDENEILELSDSIREHGVIQPIIVRTIGDKYEIIAGERRYKASVLAGKETVPVIVKNLNDKDSAEIALIENIQRKNLTPIEEALSYKKILDMGYITQEALANKLGKSQSAVANKVRLLNLSDEVQEALLENKISERHARSLLRLKSSNEQNEMLDKIVLERLTVRRTDDEIDKILKGIDIEKEEEGEEKMNNEMNQIPNVVTPTVNDSFDIFGGISQVQPATPVMPSMEIPTVQPVISEATEINTGIQFDANGNVISTGEMPTAPIEITPNNEVPISNIEIPTSISESVVTPEPIIITDYNKQYDPVMMNQVVEPANKVDFKEIISIIRECSSKIEQYGYRIDMEEYDLSSIYQVVFKIEK